MARAPRAYSSSITWLVRSRRTIARTATQPGSASGETVGDSSPGVMRHAFSQKYNATPTVLVDGKQQQSVDLASLKAAVAAAAAAKGLPAPK